MNDAEWVQFTVIGGASVSVLIMVVLWGLYSIWPWGLVLGTIFAVVVMAGVFWSPRYQHYDRAIEEWRRDYFMRPVWMLTTLALTAGSAPVFLMVIFRWWDIYGVALLLAGVVTMAVFYKHPVIRDYLAAVTAWEQTYHYAPD